MSIDAAGIGPLVEALLALEGREAREVSVSFVTPEEICRLHDEYFDDPSLTDCISFPMDEASGPDAVLGDVVVCPQVAAGDYEELTLYVVHSLLHLLGYRDGTEEECKEMRAAERRHMENAKKRGLLLRCGSS